MASVSAAGLTYEQYRAKLRGARSLYGAGSPQVQQLRSSYTGARPGTPAPASSAGAPPAPSYTPPTQLPFSATYNATVNATNRNQANNETDFAAQEANLSRDYFDPNNPYNRANLLKESYERQRRSAATSLASGQLYSGAFQNAQDATLQDYQRGENQLHTDYSDQVAALIRQRQRSRDEATSGIELAGAARLDEALRRDSEDPGASSGAGAAPKPPASNATNQAFKTGGPSPGPGYQWNPTAYKWVKTGSPPGPNYKWDFAKNRWVKK